jgi:peptide/nickel transport system substrate-binding protein
MRNLFYFLLAFLTVLACGVESSYENAKIFRYNEPTGINSLDPAFAKQQSTIWATHQIFNGLVQMDNALNITPCIAKSWQIDSTGTQYTFEIRKDVYFHQNDCFKDSTRRVTAHDFVYSFNRLIAPETAAPGAWVLSKMENITAKDDSILIISLSEAFTPFLGILTMKYCSVVPHEAVTKYRNEFGRNPVGTGPFQFKMWADNEKLVLLKNEHYFESSPENEIPKLDAVAISFIPDRQSAFLEFSKGKLDFLSGLDAGYKDELLKADGTLQEKYASRIDINTLPFLNTEYLGINMNTRHPGLRNQKFRQALNFGINKKEMVKYLRNDIGTAANAGMVPNGLPGFTSAAGYGYHYTPEKAKELIAECQLDLTTLQPIELVTTANYRDLCEYVQNAWKKLGITVNVNVVPSSHLRELKAKGDADFFRASWIADYPDAENYLSMFYSGNFTPNGPNYTFFEDSLFDSKYQEIRKEVNDSIRYSYAIMCDSLVMHEAPVVPLFYDKVIRFYHKNIKNLEGNALNTLELKYVQKL